MTATEVIAPRWSGLVIVAATGPALTKDVAAACQGHRVLAVNDAYRRMPWAEILYACDACWWDGHKGCPDFAGEKWSSTDANSKRNRNQAAKYGLRLVEGRQKAYGQNEQRFSLDPHFIHYGRNSGFQAINLAILFGANPIVLVGYDMRGTDHFFGAHPREIARSGCDYFGFAKEFDEAAQTLPAGLEIWNATPDSGICGFKRVKLEDVLTHKSPIVSQTAACVSSAEHNVAA